MKCIDGKELKNKLNSNTKLLDIDNHDIYCQSHIVNSVNIPHSKEDFLTQVRSIVPNIEDEIILCIKPYHAKELFLAAEMLEEEGYKYILGHTLGTSDWKKAGVEIVELR